MDDYKEKALTATSLIASVALLVLLIIQILMTCSFSSIGSCIIVYIGILAFSYISYSERGECPYGWL